MGTVQVKRFYVRGNSHLDLSDPKEVEKYEQEYGKFSAFRSDVLEMAVDIEHALDILIAHVIAGKNYEQHELLHVLIFDVEFCTFMQKWKMLRTIFEIYNEALSWLTQEERKKIRRELNHFIKNRNMFAHGRLHMDVDKKER